MKGSNGKKMDNVQKVTGNVNKELEILSKKFKRK